MANIYVGQSSLRIRLRTRIDLTDASTVKVGYKKPAGTTGTWTGAVESPATDGILYADLTSANDLDTAGTWTFWAYAKFSDDREAYGDAISQTVTAVGTVV